MRSQLFSLYGLAALASLGVGAAARKAEPTVVLSARSFKHKACWTDPDALSGPGFSSPSMTVRWCARFCRGYEYFGLANGDGCHCGNSLGSGSEATDRRSCDLPCAGGKSQVCGGSAKLSLYKAKEDDACHVRPSSSRVHSSESRIVTESVTSTSPSELSSATIESAQTTESSADSASETESESPASTEEASESTSESVTESGTASASVTESETSSATLTESEPETTLDATTSASEPATETDASSTSESTAESFTESSTELGPEPTTTSELESTTTEDAVPTTTSNPESSITEEPKTTATSDAETTTAGEPETTTVTPDVETTTTEEPVTTTTEEPETTSDADTTTTEELETTAVTSDVETTGTEEPETTTTSDVDTTSTEEASTTATENPETTTTEDASTSTTETPTSTPTPCIDCQNLPVANSAWENGVLASGNYYAPTKTGNWLLASTTTGEGILELRYDSAGGYYYVYNECPAGRNNYCNVYIAQVISVEAGVTYDFTTQYFMSNVRNQANLLQISISTLPNRDRVFSEYFFSGSTNGWTDFRTSLFTPTVSGDVLITVNWRNDPNNSLVLIRNVVMQPTECRNPASELTCNTAGAEIQGV